MKEREAENGSKDLNQRYEARRENRTSLSETPRHSHVAQSRSNDTLHRWWIWKISLSEKKT